MFPTLYLSMCGILCAAGILSWWVILPVAACAAFAAITGADDDGDEEAV